MKCQQGILFEQVPAVARHVFFTLSDSKDVPRALAALADRVDGTDTVAGLGTAAVQADIAKMRSILAERFLARQCAASSEIVLLQDGVYVPWKKAASQYNVWQLVKWRWFTGMDLRYVCHEEQWTTAGPGSTHLDAERAISTGLDVTG
ncbi:MAG: hypothetical protein QMB92_07395, partial [Thiopseudomonas sp.]